MRGRKRKKRDGLKKIFRPGSEILGPWAAWCRNRYDPLVTVASQRPKAEMAVARIAEGGDPLDGAQGRVHH